MSFLRSLRRPPLAALALPAALAATPARADTGTTPDQIIAGDPVTDDEFRSVVGITTSAGTICTGTLINSTTVLTAAHCVDPALLFAGMDDPPDDVEYFVTFARDLNTAGPSGRLAVASVDWHDAFPNIDRSTLDEKGPKQWHDVAIVRLAEPVTDRPFQKLATVGGADLLEVGATYHVVGYGLTSNSSAVAGVLTHGTSQLDTVGSYEIAVGDQDRQQACRGDSGGPVLTADGVQVGIASRINMALSPPPLSPPPCEPGLLYTRVDAYAGWIGERLSDDGDETAGCGCRTGGDGAGAAMVLAAAALIATRRRRSA
jgi:MYXO-CTERM domain-containing protein